DQRCYKSATKVTCFSSCGYLRGSQFVEEPSKCFLCDGLILVFDHSQSSMGMFQLMHSHFIFLDSVKAILVHCAHRLLSESTLILCTGTRPVEGKRPATSRAHA